MTRSAEPPARLHQNLINGDMHRQSAVVGHFGPANPFNRAILPKRTYCLPRHGPIYRNRRYKRTKFLKSAGVANRN